MSKKKAPSLSTERPKVLKILELADWQDITPRLLKHAQVRCRAMRWKTPENSLPQGFTVEDLVYEAIADTFNGAIAIEKGNTRGGEGERLWNPNKVDLVHFLKWAINSKIDQLLNLIEHTDTEFFWIVDQWT